MDLAETTTESAEPHDRQEEQHMNWRFRLHLKGIEEFTDPLADRMYGACPDATIASSSGRAWMDFDREADTLQSAIHSAVADARRLGLGVGRVEIEEQDLAQEELARWPQPA
jgi:hypothetical protein